MDAIEDEQRHNSLGLGRGVRDTKAGQGKRKHGDEVLVVHGQSGNRREETAMASNLRAVCSEVQQALLTTKFGGS